MRVRIEFKIEDTRLNCKNGTTMIRTYNVQSLTESAVLGELRRHIKVDDNHKIILIDYKVLHQKEIEKLHIHPSDDKLMMRRKLTKSEICVSNELRGSSLNFDGDDEYEFRGTSMDFDED